MITIDLEGEIKMFTRGPWIYADGFIKSESPQFRSIAELLPPSGSGIQSAQDAVSLCAEQEATGKLIASAPDLLLACKNAKDCLEMPWIKQYLTSHGLPTDLAVAITILTTAIAKAEGK